MQSGPRTDSAMEAVQPAARLFEAGRLVEALRICRELLQSDPDNVHALHLHGLIAHRRGEARAAIESLERARGLGHSDPAMLNNLGEMYRGEGRLADAEACYRKALELNADYEEAGANLGLLLHAAGKLQRSAGHYFRLGLTLESVGRPGDADRIYREALGFEREKAEDHHWIGLVMERLGLLEDAAASLRTALALDPDFVEPHHDLGNILVRLRRFDEAEQCYRRALALRPGFALSQFGIAQLLLLRGDYAAGWPFYESRFEGSDRKNAAFFLPLTEQLKGIERWKGENLEGKPLLVWTEQGFGDSLMGLRYLGDVKRRAAGRLIVYCEPGLVRLVRAMDCADEVISRESPVPHGRFGCHCPLMSLPLIFDTRIETIPREVPYLRVPPALTQKWSAKLASIAAPRVGLVWAGGRMLRSEPMRTRSIVLQQFAPIVRVGGARFVSLQKDGSEEIVRSGLKIHDWMGECEDFLDTAALVEQLDLVISVDTSVAHLAGALGKPVWMLNRFESEWRWLLEGERAPWYPTMRIFRQPAAGDWAAPVERAAAELEKLVAQARPRSWLKRLLAS